MNVSRSVFSQTSSAGTERSALHDRFASRVHRITVSAIKQMPILARQVGGCVSLGQGIPSLRTPQFILEELSALLLHDSSLGVYSLQPGMPELQEEVARYLNRRLKAGLTEPEREVMISCGAMEAVAAAVFCVVEPGDEVILPSPTYASHIEQVLLAGGTPKFVELDEGEGWRLDPERLRAAITPRTKAILLSNPSNPIGTVLSAAEMEAVADIVIERDLFLISDETYEFLLYDREHLSFVAMPRLRERLFAAFSFSKMFCMTGYRVGFLVSSVEGISHALKIHDAVALCAPTISQHAARIGLRATHGVDGDGAGPGDRALAEIVSVMKRRRDLSVEWIRKLGGFFSVHVPDGAYYLFARYDSAVDSRTLALQLLNEARVITIPGAAFGPSGEHHIRFSFGADEETLNEAFGRLEKWVRGKRS